MPPGGVMAEVIDNRGDRHVAKTANGAYATVLDEPTLGQRHPVCCRDRDGMPVVTELPAGCTRTAVPDAQDPCPACGTLTWDEARPSGDSSDSRRTRSGAGGLSPVVMCRTCGYEESFGVSARLEPTPFPKHGPAGSATAEQAVRAHEHERHKREREPLADVRFPIYVADGYPLWLAGRNSGLYEGERFRTGTTAVKVAQATSVERGAPQLNVETAVNGKYPLSQRIHATAELANQCKLGIRPPQPDRSEAARVLARHAAFRERIRFAACAEHGERLLWVDGRHEPFTFLRSGVSWVAARRMQEVTITISANDLDPDSLSLRRLADPVLELFDPQQR